MIHNDTNAKIIDIPCRMLVGVAIKIEMVVVVLLESRSSRITMVVALGTAKYKRLVGLLF